MRKLLKSLFIIIFYYILLYILLRIIIPLLLNKITLLLLVIALITMLIYYISKQIKKSIYLKEENKVSLISEKILLINNILNNSKFEKINIHRRKIIEKEYSRKSFDRVRAKDIIFYYLDNNIDKFLDDVKIAFENKKKYDIFLSKIKDLSIETSNETIIKSGFTKEEFKTIEKRIFGKYINDKHYYDIEVKLLVIYVTSRNKINEDKGRTVKCNELFELYENGIKENHMRQILKLNVQS